MAVFYRAPSKGGTGSLSSPFARADDLQSSCCGVGQRNVADRRIRTYKENLMAEVCRVVAHFLDGSVTRGTTSDFFPNRPSFHLVPPDGGKPQEIECCSLKALFFVKDLQGCPEREDIRGFISGPRETAHGRKVAVLFRDGELLCGYTLSFSPAQEGFMLFPADPGSNNARVFVLRGATVQIEAGPAAEALAQKKLDGLRAAG
jgi:hypothetical protein